jgi:hypothetical protein
MEELIECNEILREKTVEGIRDYKRMKKSEQR